MAYKPKVADYKKKIVSELVKLFEKYPIIASVDLENLPAKQLQKMKAQLRGKVEIFMTKRRLMNFAIDKVKDKKKNIEALKEHLVGMPALLFTSENPFLLFKTLKKSKSPAPAKAGQKAPKEIIVPAGPTSFAPGPIIGELGNVGIKAGVEQGKIVIKEDAVVAKEGDTITEALASILTRLNIMPMEIGLNLVSVYEKSVFYGRSVLDIDEEKFMADLNQAAAWGTNLAVEIAYPTKEILPLLIQKTFRESKSLALEAGILAKEFVQDILAKAERQANALKQL